jgi:transposase
MEDKSKKSKRYSSEFKIDAVNLVLKEGYRVPKAAKSLGISDKVLYSWKKQYAEGRIQVGHKQAVATAEEQELRKLREELRQVKMENEILKKASAFSPSKSTSTSLQIYT